MKSYGILIMTLLSLAACAKGSSGTNNTNNINNSNNINNANNTNNVNNTNNCTNQCAIGEGRCDGTKPQTCGDDGMGCLIYVSGTDCALSSQICEMSGQTPLCVDTCTDQCTLGESSCDGNILHTCVNGPNGCTVDEAGDDCAATGRSCTPSGTTASCTCNDTCTEDVCNGTVPENCTADTYGCFAPITATDCAASGQICSLNAGVASCACDDQCTLNEEQCDGTMIQQCLENAGGCLDWADVTDCAGSGLGCSVAAGVASCTSSAILLDEGFTTWVGSAPTGWTVSDGADVGYTWVQCTTCSQLSDFTIHTGAVAFIDSDDFIDFDDSLISPALDCSGRTTITLEFDHSFKTYTSDYGHVDVSTNGGSTWTNEVFLINSVSIFNSHETIDISSIAAGSSNVKIRFRYVAYFDYHWLIDNVRVTAL
ncbi:choice-of-anchor J domain-containing protein [Myxococcota bacterium]|nr:choice-of-anchor J domain-containing protein [Myxococcota bacterium]MBU1536581.1 choice-of-anchor J domain-containing protein [Myxococcota bacterium]